MARVSIGLPVYNGERHIRQAIESILDQTFADFELIISDNASTDGTEAICRRYADVDERVTYHRHARNLGAAPNFNFTFAEARGEYFKWAACDDLIRPRFLEECVRSLDENPEAALCFCLTSMIGEDDEALGAYAGNVLYESEHLSKRFPELIKMHGCYEIFGLIRADMLKKTGLIVSSFYGDGILLANLGLLGRFVMVREEMFVSRKHAGQSIQMTGDTIKYASWFDPNNGSKIILPYWRILKEYTGAVRRAPIGLAQKYLCMRSVVGFAWTKRNILRGDLVWAAQRVRSRYLRYGAP